MPLSPVLDIRRNQGNSMTGLRVTQARARGEKRGYVVEAQRRQHQGLQGVAIRLTAPDGRSLDVMGPASQSNSRAAGPVSSALSPEVGLVFRETLTPATTDQCVAAIDAAINTGIRLLDRDLSGDPARFQMQCAALRLDPDEAVRFYMRIEELTRAGINLSPREIRDLTVNGFSPETTVEWFQGRNAIYVPRSSDDVAKVSAFRDNGWAPVQYRDLAGILKKYPKRAWARLEPTTAMLAARAGIGPQEAVTMVADGSWDAAGVGLLVALRDPDGS